MSLDIKVRNREPESPQPSKLRRLVVTTTLGAQYVFPDLTDDAVSLLMQQLSLRSEQIVVRNLSEATLVIPFRIFRDVAIDDGVSVVAHWSKP